MEGFLFLYVIRFSLQLFFSESLFLAHFNRRKHFILRLIGGASIYFLIGYGLHLFMRNAQSLLELVMAFTFLILFLLSILFAYFLFDIYIEDALFVGIGGYAVQHIAFVLQSFLQTFWLSHLTGIAENVVLKTLPYLVIGVFVYLFVIKPNIDKGEQKDKDIKLIFLGVAFILAVIFLSVYVDTDGTGLERGSDDMSNWIVARLYGMLFCVMALFVQFSLTIQNKLQHENNILERLIQIENQQHDIAKENMDLINIKYHDLKHQIHRILELDDREARQAYLEEIGQTISIYDSMMKTGNEALDVVLTEKSLLCDKHKIQFSSMIDGKKLNFINAADLYSLFGNALDNAIESVIQIADEDKRIISLTMNEMSNMLYIHVENYYRKAPVFKNGMPVSSKKERDYHGYGTKSIRYIVDRYQGELTMYIEDGQFHLDILFPL